MSEELEDIPTLSDDVFEGEDDAEPNHELIDDDGNIIETEGDDDAEA